MSLEMYEESGSESRQVLPLNSSRRYNYSPFSQAVERIESMLRFSGDLDDLPLFIIAV